MNTGIGRMLGIAVCGLLLAGCGPDLIFYYDTVARNESGRCCGSSSGNGGGITGYDEDEFPITIALTISVQEQTVEGRRVPLQSLETALEPTSHCTEVMPLECLAGVCMQTLRLNEHGLCLLRLKGVARGETIESCYSYGVARNEDVFTMSVQAGSCE